jgi:hypothetical protein
MPKKKTITRKQVDALAHEDAKRKNIPTAEFESVMDKDAQTSIELAYARRNRDLDPQLVWRGKDEQDWSHLVVQAPPLSIQEKAYPKVLIDDLRRRTDADEAGAEPQMDGNQAHITLKSIANNAEIDVIWDNFQEKLKPLRQQLNETLRTKWEDWEIPRELTDAHFPKDIRVDSRAFAVSKHKEWWQQRIARQQEPEENHPQSRNQPRSLGDPLQRHLPPLQQTQIRKNRRQSHQPPGR